MPIPPNATIIAQIKADMDTEGFDLSKAPLTDKFVEILVTKIVDNIKLATVTTSVAVASATSLSPGVPGAGVGTGGIS